MKKIKYFIFSLFIISLLSNRVMAASMTATVTSTSVTVGNTISLKITGKDLAGKFSITSSNSSIVNVSSSSTWIDNSSVTIKLTAKKIGTAKVTVAATDVTTYAGKAFTEGKTFTITVKEAVKETPKVKSTNNYLSSLSVNGYSISPKFDKEVLEYSLSLEPDTESIKINAQLADSTAKVSGTGSQKVSIGLNTFNIVVTAENGSKRTYNLKVTVKDYDPIKVNVDGHEYTVIRREKELPKLSEYNEIKKVTIGEDTVDGYYNSTLDYTLVGLMDKDGNTGIYIYDSGKYKVYNEYTFNGITVYYLDKNVSGDVKKTSFKYNDDVIPAYQNVKLDLIKNTYALTDNDIEGNQFYLFYAINLDSGKEELYQYDAKEKTIQRFNTELLDLYKDRSDKYYLILLGAILLLGVNIILFSVITISSKKKKKHSKKKDKKKNVKDIDL